jgi:hypothetical protein
VRCTKVEGRKAFAEGKIETLDGKLIAEAKYVSLHFFRVLSLLSSFSLR